MLCNAVESVIRIGQSTYRAVSLIKIWADFAGSRLTWCLEISGNCATRYVIFCKFIINNSDLFWDMHVLVSGDLVYWRLLSRRSLSLNDENWLDFAAWQTQLSFVVCCDRYDSTKVPNADIDVTRSAFKKQIEKAISFTYRWWEACDQATGLVGRERLPHWRKLLLCTVYQMCDVLSCMCIYETVPP